ncbi:MAG: hypothetical protein K9J38_01215 [Polynucleobacter sp.]|nr:hypothetical protein [Polynucleobacter sp.]
MIEVLWTVAEKMKKFIFLLLGFNVILANAAIFDKKLTLYSCPEKRYINCDACEKSEVKVDFLINKYDRTVMFKTYFKENSNSSIFNNCKIFDEKNWDCSSKSELIIRGGAEVTHTIRKMTDGIFQGLTYTNIATDRLKTVVEGHSCAK